MQKQMGLVKGKGRTAVAEDGGGLYAAGVL